LKDQIYTNARARDDRLAAQDRRVGDDMWLSMRFRHRISLCVIRAATLHYTHYGTYGTRLQAGGGIHVHGPARAERVGRQRAQGVQRVWPAHDDLPVVAPTQPLQEGGRRAD